MSISQLIHAALGRRRLVTISRPAIRSSQSNLALAGGHSGAISAFATWAIGCRWTAIWQSSRIPVMTKVPSWATNGSFFSRLGMTQEQLRCFPTRVEGEGGWGRAQRAPRSRGWGLDARSSRLDPRHPNAEVVLESSLRVANCVLSFRPCGATSKWSRCCEIGLPCALMTKRHEPPRMCGSQDSQAGDCDVRRPKQISLVEWNHRRICRTNAALQRRSSRLSIQTS